MTQDRRPPIRRGPWPESTSRPMVTPLQPSVVYASPDPDALDRQYAEGSGYTYAREGHPNAEVLARQIDALEGAEGGVVTGSGMAAIGAMALAALRTGDHVVGGDQLYGRSLRMLREDLPRMGIATSLADPTDAAAIRAALRPETRLILVETVSNPTIRVADIAGIARVAREAGVLLAVDNTFTTPRLFRPFEHGADIVIHSITKLLAGHSDATLGYVASRDPALRQAMLTAHQTWGLTASPFDCWLAERGLMTYDLRLDRAERNAAEIAEALAGCDGVRRVLYPTRPDHPDHNRAVTLFDGRGGTMLSFEIEGGRAAANRLTRAAARIPFAPTLGDVSTTLSHPASSSHRGMTAEERAGMGVSEGFFRLSVGVEEPGLVAAELVAAVRAALA